MSGADAHEFTRCACAGEHPLHPRGYGGDIGTGFRGHHVHGEPGLHPFDRCGPRSGQQAARDHRSRSTTLAEEVLAGHHVDDGSGLPRRRLREPECVLELLLDGCEVVPDGRTGGDEDEAPTDRPRGHARPFEGSGQGIGTGGNAEVRHEAEGS